MTDHYGWWMTLPHEKFQQVIDLSNQVNVLLAAHWIAVKQIMAIITDAENRCKAKTPDERAGDIDVGILRWLKYLNAHVEREYLVYNQWPMWVEAQLDRDRSFFGRRE